MAAITVCSDFGAQKNKVSHCFHCYPIYLPWSDGTRYHDLSFLMLSFKPSFSLSSFTFIKRLFSSSSLSAIRVGSSAHLRLLIFLPEILPSWKSERFYYRRKREKWMVNTNYQLMPQTWNTNFHFIYIVGMQIKGFMGKLLDCWSQWGFWLLRYFSHYGLFYYC